ncbi:MAG: hypothetical protein AAGH72_12025 [Verrucomicrobiota bacterium]
MKRILVYWFLSCGLLPGVQSILAVSAPSWSPFGTSYSRLGENTDKHGYLIEKIPLANLDLGQGLQLPLFIQFNTSPVSTSQHLADRWSIPLLDSHLWQEKERTLRAVMPLGKEKYFEVDKTGAVTHRSREWSGQVSNQITTLKHSGGLELVYDQGRLKSMKLPDGRMLEWERSRGKVARIRFKRGEDILALNPNVAKGFEFSIPNGSDTPQVVSLAFEPVYGSVREISYADGSLLTLKRGVRKDFTPYLEIENGDAARFFEWNQQTGKISRDHHWDYQITEVEKKRLLRPKMKRTHRQHGYSEGYYYDPYRGITEILSRDGTTRREFQVLTAGKNFKALRKLEVEKAGNTVILQQAAFDDQGNLLKEMFYNPATGTRQTRRFDTTGQLVDYQITGKFAELVPGQADLQAKEMYQQAREKMKAIQHIPDLQDLEQKAEERIEKVKGQL